MRVIIYGYDSTDDVTEVGMNIKETKSVKNANNSKLLGNSSKVVQASFDKWEFFRVIDKMKEYGKSDTNKIIIERVSNKTHTSFSLTYTKNIDMFQIILLKRETEETKSLHETDLIKFLYEQGIIKY